jgi:peptidyl-prolyl cis-trans isomerase D
MLSAIRAFAKSPFATGLLAILIVSFGLWGIKDVFRTGGFTDLVVKAGSRPAVTKAQFKQIFDEERTSQEQRLGQPLSVQDALKGGLDREVAERLGASEALGALMSAEGINPSDQLVANEIRKITVFFNPITGQFDKNTYLRALQSRNLTEAQADAEFRDTVAQHHYLEALAAGLKAPRIYGLVQAAILKQGLNFTWFALGANTVEQPAKPTDAEMNAFLKENAAQATKPELRVLSVVNISAAKLGLTLPAPEAEVQKRFDFEKDTLSSPEKRTVVEVAVKDMASGARVAQALRAGGNPVAIAKANGGQATTFTATAKSAIADRKLADVAFNLKDNEVAGPIQGDLSLAVIKVIDIIPAKTATLADSRAKIETEVKQQDAKQKVYDIVQKYEDAHSGGAPLAAAAKSAGAEVVTLPPIRAEGATLDGRRVNIPPKVLQQAFSLPQGGETDVIDMGQGEYWAVHVDQIIPPTLLTLDEKVGSQTVRDVVSRQIMMTGLFKRLHAKADALLAEIKKGKSMEAAAAEVGAKLTQASDVTRAAAQPTAPGQPPPYSGDLLGHLFQSKPGDIIAAQDTKPGLVIARLDKLDEPAPDVLAGLAEAARPQITRSLFNDLGEATTLAAQKKIKTTIDMKQAHQALGITDDAAGAAGSTGRKS